MPSGCGGWEGWGARSKKAEESKKVANLLAAIEARRTPPFDRFIFALGIRRIGEANAKLLARHYHSLPEWRERMLAARIIGSEAREELGSIQGIGPAIATELVDFFDEPRNLAALDDLAQRGDARRRSPAPPRRTAPSPARPWSSPARSRP